MGKLIVVEGLDGSGKATQSELLAQYLLNRGVQVRKVSFPNYESNGSALVKMYLAGEFGTRSSDVNAYAASSFYAVDRYASYKKDWENDYRSGIVIADRYTTSNAIHQCSKLPEDQWDEFLDWLFDYEYRLLGIPEPNIVMYLKVDLAVSQELLKVRYHSDMTRKDIHEKDRDYLLRCQKAADYCAEKLDWKVIECIEDGAMRPIEDIADDIQKLVKEKVEMNGSVAVTGAADSKGE